MRVVTNTIQDKMSGEESASAEADLDSLMDKYDDKEKKDKEDKDSGASKAAKPVDPNQPSKAQVQDLELKILSGNMMSEYSAKAGEDDVINEALDKFTKQGKSGSEVIAKEDAQDACNEIYEKIRQVDSYTAIDDVKAKFNKVWAEHDVNNQTFLERTEAYNLV